MKKDIEKYWNEHGIKYAKKVNDEAFFAGYHIGRHKCREKLAQSGWLIIDPNKREEFEKCLEDPCKYCEHYTLEYRKGCNLDPQQCEIKQKQILAQEIKLYFDILI